MADLREAIAELLGIRPQHADEWTILCPSPEHNDNSPSASIYVGEPQERQRGGKTVLRLPGMWVCYSCHRAGRISNDRIVSYEPSFDRNLEVAMQNLEETDVRIYPEAWLDLYDYPGGVHPYWLSRFSEMVCRRHRLGYDYERDAGTYPLRDPAGRVLGVVRRAFDPDARIKYRYPKGIDLHAEGFLYGYSEAVALDAQTVVLVEGALDAVAVDEAGHHALAIYGSNPSQAQIKMINRLYPKTVILAFDDDDAGHSATRKVFDSDLVCTDVRVVDLDGYNDIADMPVSRRRAAIDTAGD